MFYLLLSNTRGRRKFKNRTIQKMSSLLLNPENPAFQPEWALKNITSTFFKCIRWKVEETIHLTYCPLHYFCDDTYPDDYHPIVDTFILILTLLLYLSTIVFILSDISRARERFVSGGIHFRRFWLPSGPIALPFILLALARGYRVNTLLPGSCIGPALVQLVQISALAFENKADSDVKYSFLEVSTVSGILHSSLYLDSILLPYYTGLDALLSSTTFSGECPTCVCRKEVLVVGGGRWAGYRGWSVTMLCVVGAVCSRMVCKFCGQNKDTRRRTNLVIRSLLETSSWVLIAKDCVHLMMDCPQCGFMEKGGLYGGIGVLICLQVLRKLCIVQLLPWQVKTFSESKSIQV